MLSVQAIFRLDTDFKSAYLLTAIVILVTAVVFFIVAMLSFNPILAYAAQFIVGALIYGFMMKEDGEPIGLGKGCLVSILTTVITIGIWFLAGPFLAGMFG